MTSGVGVTHGDVTRDIQFQTRISFPVLNNLVPTTESCTMKVFEEFGELMQLIGKGQGKSGEKLDLECCRRDWAIDTIKETIDTAQAAITMTLQLCKEYDIDITAMMVIHEMKLREKGYLV